MNLLVVIGFYAFVCVGAFLLGLRLYRTTRPRADVTPEQVRRFGRLLMMGATAMFLFMVALIVHGDLPVLRAVRS
jgi:hypothetical protein